MDSESEVDMNKIVISGSQKQNLSKFHVDFRGSIYRGVSRNGRAWQILIVIDSERVYLCTTNDPQTAALLYDIAVVQIKGMRAKVNFKYTKLELLAILFTPSLIELKNKRQNKDRSQQF